MGMGELQSSTQVLILHQVAASGLLIGLVLTAVEHRAGEAISIPEEGEHMKSILDAQGQQLRRQLGVVSSVVVMLIGKAVRFAPNLLPVVL